MNEEEKLAWIYLRALIEGSRRDIITLLWGRGLTGMIEGDETPVVEISRKLRNCDPSLPPELLRVAQNKNPHIDPEKIATEAEKSGMRILTPRCEEWPEHLLPAFQFWEYRTDNVHSSSEVRGYPAPPFALWVQGQGSLKELSHLSVAIVGTRASSKYGDKVASTLSEELSEQGYCIISGGAYGIDTAAHRACVRADGRSIAVLASGLDRQYPAANKELFEKICVTGVCVSEYTPGLSPARHRFLTRNRLVAALSLGTVIVEAPWRSGALNTANWAEQMLRPVMAIPGPITSAHFSGNHHRIRTQRAELVTNAQEIRELCEPLGTVDPQRELELEFPPNPIQELSTKELEIYDSLPRRTEEELVGGDIKSIIAQTGMDMRTTMRIIKKLYDEQIIFRYGEQWYRDK